jgi:hypothetical protein
MPFDTSNLPIGGMTVITFVTYAAVSAFGTGPWVNGREIEKLDWPAICEADLRADISARRKPEKVIPKTDCQSMLGGLMPELGRLCTEIGNPDLGGPLAGAAREQERRLREAEDRRIASAASKSSSKCDCATSVYQAEQKVALAIYAGTARAIIPPSVRNLESELTRALHSPQCKANWE